MPSIKEQMRFWGHYQQREYCAPLQLDDVEAPEDHPLARARKFAPGTKAKAERQLVPRDGSSRRILMGLAAGLRGKDMKPRALPMDFVDPIRCKESVVLVSRTPTAAITVGSPPGYEWIDRALSQLHRQNTLRAMVVREEFTGAGRSQDEKARAVAKQYGGSLTKWQYRAELEKGLAFLEGKR